MTGHDRVCVSVGFEWADWNHSAMNGAKMDSGFSDIDTEDLTENKCYFLMMTDSGSADGMTIRDRPAAS